MKKFFSRYRPRYLRSLVYMLQTTEYQTREYISWLKRVEDFGAVERRGQLDRTPKAYLLLLSAWVIAAKGVLSILWFVTLADVLVSVMVTVAVLGLLVGPLLIPYLLLVPLFFIQLLLETPVTLYLRMRASRIIKSHPAIKVAIAGSYGKTTFKEILHTVLRQAKQVSATPGNMNTPIGIARFARKLTGQEEVLIFELGEYRPGDIKQLAKISKPSIGIITGINEAHLDKFKSIEKTADTVFELAGHPGIKKVYVNAEDAQIARRSKKDYISFSSRGCGGWKVASAVATLKGTTIEVRKGKTILKAKSGLLGLHHVGMLAAAVAIADKLGLSSDQIKQGIEATRPFEHRLEPQYRSGGVTVLDDTYNGNPDGVREVIKFLKAIKAKRKIYITPGLVEMGERSQQVHLEIGKQLAGVVDEVFLIRNSVTPYIEDGLKKSKFSGKIRWFEDSLECYRTLDSFTQNGDVVLMQNDWPDQYA